MFELLAKQYELARVDESREGAVIQVVDVAQPPERKSKPKKGLIAVMATLVTGMLLMVFVFLRNAVQNSAATPEATVRLTQLRASLTHALGRQRS